MIDFPEELKSEKVWGVVSTWSVDVLYDDLTYAEAMAFAQEEAKKEGQHTKIVLIVRSIDGPPLPPIKPRKKALNQGPL
jgi:hypothetical protein